MGYPTHDEFVNWRGRIKWYYDHDSPIERPWQPATKLDDEGDVVWDAKYFKLRTVDNVPHEQATQQILTEIEAIEHPQPSQAHPFIGPIRISGLSYVDDTGMVLPVLCHYGSSFSDWVHGKTSEVLRQLDVIQSADYHGIRFWDTLGYYDGGWGGREVAPISFTNKSGATIPATPDYYGKLQAFLQALKDRSLVAHHSRGDLNSWAKPAILNHGVTVGQVQRAVGLNTIALNEACNEAQLNIGDWSAAFLDEMIKAINNPSVLKALSDVSQNEDTATLVTYARDMVYIHGYRGGDQDIVGQIRHIHSLRYDGAVKVANKVGWQGEPAGRGTSGPNVTRTDSLVLMAMQAWCCRQAWNYTSGNGIWGTAPIENEPGFREVPKARYWLPKDCMTYADAFHGGTTWKGKRILVAEYPDGRLRADHRLNGKDLTITVHAKPGQTWALPVERAFTGHVIDPIQGPQADRTWQAGQMFDFDGRDRTGVVVVGHLL